MLALISPAKKLDFESEWNTDSPTQPAFMEDTKTLASTAKKLSTNNLKSLMSISDNLAELNHNRFQNFTTPFTPQNARPAITAFKGDTYVGLDAETLSNEDIKYAQNHLRILSGLYGLLRPRDLMQPYRLEMGTKLHNERGEDLYDFWGNHLTNACTKAVKTHKDKTIISLASNEYIKAIKVKELNTPFLTCHFKEIKDGTPKIIGLFAKRARGAMARFIIQNKCETPEALKDFNTDGYKFSKPLSDEKNYVFTRKKS